MKHYGVNVFDFTPNLTADNVDSTPFPINWRQNLRVRRVYAHRMVSRYKSHQSFSKSGWVDPNVNVPVWYTLYDAAYMNPAIYSGFCYVGITYSSSDGYYYASQAHMVFDTAFIGANSLVVAAELTCCCYNHYIPFGYNLVGTGVYCNVYASTSEYINTRHQGYPVNVPADGSGFAARFGPYPALNPSNALPRWDAYYSYDTAVLSPSAINKVGHTALTALTSDFLTMSAGTGRYIFGYLLCAWVTVYYAAL